LQSSRSVPSQGADNAAYECIEEITGYYQSEPVDVNFETMKAKPEREENGRSNTTRI